MRTIYRVTNNTTWRTTRQLVRLGDRIHVAREGTQTGIYDIYELAIVRTGTTGTRHLPTAPTASEEPPPCLTPPAIRTEIRHDSSAQRGLHQLHRRRP